MKRYQLEVRGGLFFTQVALKQQESVRFSPSKPS